MVLREKSDLNLNTEIIFAKHVTLLERLHCSWEALSHSFELERYNKVACHFKQVKFKNLKYDVLTI